ncbi:hypothetical protein [Dishui Lake phycodnavirus 4]|nr:hypothetical protein [Dishui Lake phycodnavirus 4]
MIEMKDIKPNDIIKVLVYMEEEDIEEEVYARVVDNRGDHLEINYLEETNKMYKNARVYVFRDEVDVIGKESLIEHYSQEEEEEIIEEVFEFAPNMYVFVDEYDVEDDDSAVYTEDDDEDDYSIGSFVVDDADDVDGAVDVPSDHKKIDKEWNEWEPRSPGARSFKETINRIEYYAKKQADENNF